MTASAPRSWPFFPIHLFHLHKLASFSAELRFVTEPRAPLFLYGPTPLEYFSNGDTLSPKMFFDCHAVNSPNHSPPPIIRKNKASGERFCQLILADVCSGHGFIAKFRKIPATVVEGSPVFSMFLKRFSRDTMFSCML
jgi:hypothetical protein